MISILIVNWNGMRFLADCLHSIQERVSTPYQVIVVDNHSTDDSCAFIAENFPWVKLVQSLSNLGFGKGNNLAAKYASGETLMLLNYDTVLLADPSPMAQALFEDDSIGCIGAKMCNGSGDVVPNCGHFPTPLRLLLFRSVFWNPYKGDAALKSVDAQLVDWVEGSWLLLRRETWERVGGFDERIFMYGEDVEICKRISDLGLKVIQVATLAYRHYVGWSASRLPLQIEGFRVYHRKHSSRVPRAFAEIILTIGLKTRLYVYSVLTMLKGDPSFREKRDALRNASDSAN